MALNDGETRDAGSGLPAPPPGNGGQLQRVGGVRRGSPTNLRDTFEQFAFFRREEGIDKFIHALPLQNMPLRQVYYAVHGRAPDSFATAVYPPEMTATDAFLAALKSDEFRRNFVPRFLSAFPEKRRLFFVHVPKCAGVDLSSYLISLLPSLKTQVLDPEWATRIEFYNLIKDLVLEIKASDSIYIHGHNTLLTYSEWSVLRFEDEIFTIVREPISRVLSQVNYVLTRIFSDEVPIAPDTQGWRQRFNVDDLAISHSAEQVLKLARRCLYDEEVVEPNVICRYLGSGTYDSAIEQSVIHQLEITDTSRYDEWCWVRWGRREATRRNVSRPYVSLGDFTSDDRAYIASICTEDLKFHRLIIERLEQSGRCSLFGHELVDDAQRARAVPHSNGIMRDIDGAFSLRIIAQGLTTGRFFSESEPEHGVTPELEMAFGMEGNSHMYVREGWSGPEAGYTWTAGHLSRLQFPRPVRVGAYRLRVLGRPYIWIGSDDQVHPQRLLLQVNGLECGAVTVTGEPAVLECDLPWSTFAGSDEVELVWSLPDAVRPSEVKGIADDRLLAFRFERIELSPICVLQQAGEKLAFAAMPSEISEPARSALPATALTGGHTGVASQIETEDANSQGPSTQDRADTRLPLDVPSLSDRELMLRFESIGENCEFGLVQRRCGAEPLGLFRFASAPLPKLLAGLEEGFEGLSDPDNLEVQLSPNGREYMVYDRKYQLLYHAWVLAEEMSAEAVHQREVRRLPLLIRKLIEDLRQAEKIFIFHGMEPLSTQQAQALLARLRGFGPNILLWLELADAAHPAGTVEWVGEGLLKGYMDRFAPGENAHDLSLDCWLAVCREAYRLWRDDKTSQVSAAAAAMPATM